MMSYKSTLLRAILLSIVIIFSSASRATESATVERPLKKIKIYLIGDSTCATKKEAARPETGWGERLEELFDRSVTVDNRAMNGRSSKSFRAEGRWDDILTTLSEGDWVLIQFGHNDEKIDKPNIGVSTEEYSENLRRFVEQTRDKGANPILLTSIVRRNFDANAELQPTHGLYPQCVRDVATQMNVPLIDMEEITKEVVSKIGEEPSKKIYLWVEKVNYPNLKQDKQDNTHLSEYGAELYASLVAQAIKESNIAELSLRLKK